VQSPRFACQAAVDKAHDGGPRSLPDFGLDAYHDTYHLKNDKSETSPGHDAFAYRPPLCHRSLHGKCPLRTGTSIWYMYEVLRMFENIAGKMVILIN
jgi:hypothetical protein